jgi:hypothetical protein
MTKRKPVRSFAARGAGAREALEDRRRFPRVGIFQEILFGNRKPHRMNDLSEEGMFIATPDTYLPGSRINLTFRLFGEERPIETVAEVLYAQDGVGMGVRFVRLSPAHRRRICAFVKRLVR